MFKSELHQLSNFNQKAVLILSAILAFVLLMMASANVQAGSLSHQSGSDDPLGSRSTMSDAKVDARTAPVAKVKIAGQEDESDQVAAEVPFSAEDKYSQKCAMCHASGAAGAPIVGKADQWSDRIAQGMDTLYGNAINGVGAMPPKGTCMDCSDDQIKAIVDFMIK